MDQPTPITPAIPNNPSTIPPKPNDFQGNAAYPIPIPDASEDIVYETPKPDSDSIMNKEND